MGYRVWFDDLEKAIAAIREKTCNSLFCSITGNVYGDFIFQIDTDTQYIVKHNDFSVWQNLGDWRHPEWKEL